MMSEIINISIADGVCVGKRAGEPSDEKENKNPPNTPMVELNDALKACSFGRFQIRLLLSALVGLLGGVLVTNSTAYLMPKAECDLNMKLEQKGLLTAMPFFGMLVSSVVAGFLTDTFGRKLFLIIGYGGMFIIGVFAASSQTYDMLVTAKFFEGLLFAICFSPTMTLTSEFVHNDIRDIVLLCQSAFSSLCQIIIAAMSWAILPNNWNYSLFGGYFVLHTWNFYLYIISLISLAAFLMFTFLPESPKYLVSQKRYADARNLLIKIYKENTGKAADTYPYKNIWKNIETTTPKSEDTMKTALMRQVKIGLHNSKPLFMRPYLVNLILLCVSITCSMILYNTIRLWFPQLSTIVEHYSSGGDGASDLCVMLDAYTATEKINGENNTNTGVCVPNESGAETYINSMILGTVGLMPYLISGALVKKVGKKVLIFVIGITSIAATLGIRFTNTKLAVVSLFSVDSAVGQTSIGLFQIIAMEYFPTTTRTLAMSIIMMNGRIGTLISNIVFPILLKMGCPIPFYGLATMMTAVTVMSVFLKCKK